MLIYSLKFLFGLLAFTAYRFTATRGGKWLTHAGGMLLTFPALNGLGLLAADASPTAAVETMFPMIALNGLLAAGIIHMLSPANGPEGSIRRGRALAAISIASIIWVAIAIAANVWELQLPAVFHPWVTAAYAVVGLVAMAMSPQRIARKPVTKQPAFLQSEEKTILRFAVLLLFLLGAACAGAAHKTIAQLSALPLLPFYGLYAASQQENAIEALHALRRTVLLGPPVAMSFIALAAPHVEASSAPSEMSGNAIVLLGGWVVCLAIIAVISALQGWVLGMRRSV